MSIARLRRGAAPLLLLAAAMLTGCGTSKVCLQPGAAAIAGPPPPDWRDVATDADHAKLRQERATFLSGVQQARAAGFGPALDGGGRLFDPDYAQDGVALRPGAYSCRTTALGTRTAARPALVVEPARRCTIEPAGAVQRLSQLDGLQRATGRVYPDGQASAVFLGVLVLPDEATALHYGRDADRDVVGVVQRIGADRWRMVVPAPAWEATVEVIELTPAG